MGVDNTKDKPTGSIRYVLLVVSHPVEPTPPQTFAFLNSILPELEAQSDGAAKIGTQWVTTPLNSLDMTALAIEAFGNEVMNNSIFTYRTLHLGLKGGEAKCLVTYDKAAVSSPMSAHNPASMVLPKQNVTPKKWWQFWK